MEAPQGVGQWSPTPGPVSRLPATSPTDGRTRGPAPTAGHARIPLIASLTRAAPGRAGFKPAPTGAALRGIGPHEGSHPHPSPLPSREGGFQTRPYGSRATRCRAARGESPSPHPSPAPRRGGRVSNPPLREPHYAVSGRTRGVTLTPASPVKGEGVGKSPSPQPSPVEGEGVRAPFHARYSVV